jgi:4-carboxymuconolactone decarboxylase
VEAFGEAGVIDIATVYGYFITVCAVMNLAHTPAPADSKAAPIPAYPL